MVVKPENDRSKTLHEANAVIQRCFESTSQCVELQAFVTSTLLIQKAVYWLDDVVVVPEGLVVLVAVNNKRYWLSSSQVISKQVIFIKMRQTHINTHINTIAIEHRENINAMKTQRSNTTKYQCAIVFNIFIYCKNIKRYYVILYIIFILFVMLLLLYLVKMWTLAWMIIQLSYLSQKGQKTSSDVLTFVTFP